MFSAEWKDDTQCSIGKMKYANGDEYVGSFGDNYERDGHGRMCYSDRSIYLGEWKHGKRHGQGKFVSSTGDDEYEGTWKTGKRHGKGKIVVKDSQTEADWKGASFVVKETHYDVRLSQDNVRSCVIC